MTLPEFLTPGRLLAGAVTASAISLWLLLPRGRESGLARWLGTLLGIAALAGFACAGRRLGSLGEEAVFHTVSLVAVVSGAATVLTRSPVYSAIWFAMCLLGVAGVLLVLGAQFLGVATIVVYAGAILVMFLFVLMLAQPAGLAPYDRVSNEPFLSAVTAAVLLGLLTLSIGRLSAEPVFAKPVAPSAAEPAVAVAADPLAENHVARLGAELFGRHLVSVEAAGVLLLVALVGAIAVVSRGETAGREGFR
jgi:NADH-quinone oxidoreductase subunit J